MESLAGHPSAVWRFGTAGWVASLTAVLALAYAFSDSALVLIKNWDNREEYSHGYLIPLISAFLVWQRKNELQRLRFDGSWAGLAVVLAGVLLFVLGELSTLNVIMHYAMLVVLAGLALALTGYKGMKLLWPALLFLIFMIPLPPFLYNNLSAELQLISSEMGVAVIRTFGISVLLQGNVIDLGTYKLQVVEACDGLRYLFPLMSFGFLAAYFFRAPVWQKLIVFVSSIPVTVLMNSLRIGVIGVMVEYWGTAMAEGFLHDFEGWVIFMTCVGLLVLEMWLLTRLTGREQSLRDVFRVELPESIPRTVQRRPRKIPKPYLSSVAMVVLAAGASYGIAERAEAIPFRQSFASFPTQVGEWKGRESRLEDMYLIALKLTDYVMSDFTNPRGDRVNLYAAYYASQRTGESAHSPRACIPGGGWEIRKLSRPAVQGIVLNGKPMRVNRAEIQMGNYRQLVYYWFQQRGRIITSEYLVKWYLFWDALTRNRTDGALVRLTTGLRPTETWADADARLASFARAVKGTLASYIPGSKATIDGVRSD